MSQFSSYPGQVILKVPTAADLPVAASNGIIALTLDTDVLYVFSTDSMTWLILSSPTAVVLTVGNIDSQVASSNGAVITGASLVMQSASDTAPGLVNNTTQSFSGDKTFTDALIADNIITIPSAQVVYVSKSGDDSTGTGSILTPFLTIKAAQDSILDAAFDKLYIINVGPGDYLEDPSYTFASFICIQGSGSNDPNFGTQLTTLDRSDNTPITWTATDFDQTLKILNITLVNGMTASVDPTFTGASLYMNNVTLFTTFDLTGNADDNIFCDFLNGIMFASASNFNLAVLNIENSKTLQLIATDALITLRVVRHTRLNAIGDSNITRHQCSFAGGNPPFTLDGPNAVININEEGALFFLNLTADFVLSSDIMTTANPNIQVGRGIISSVLPADTIVLASAGVNMWQLSNVASATVTGQYIKLVRAVFASGALISNLRRDAQTLQAWQYNPRNPGDWGTDVPSFPTDALDILAANLTPTAGANTALSNLLTTSINQDLIPASDDARSLGSSLVNWISTWTNKVKKIMFDTNSNSFNFGPTETIQIDSSDVTVTSLLITSTDTADDTASKDVNISTGSVTGAATTASAGDFHIYTGSVEDGTGTTGDLFIASGDGGNLTGSILMSTGYPTTGSRGVGSLNAAHIYLQPDDYLELQSIYNSYAWGNVSLLASDSSGSSNPVTVGSTDTASTATKEARLTSGSITGAATSASTGEVDVQTGFIADGSGQTGDLYLSTGSVDAGAGNTGDIFLAVGTTSGTRGRIDASAKTIFLNPDLFVDLSGAYTSANITWIIGGTGQAVLSDTSVGLFGTQDKDSSDTKPVMIASGAVTGAATTNSTGTVAINSGLITNGTSGSTGGIAIQSGDVLAGNASTGDVDLFTGNAPGSGNSGSLVMFTGGSTSGTRGNLQLNVNNIINVASDNSGSNTQSEYLSQLSLTQLSVDVSLVELALNIALYDAQQIEYVIKDGLTGDSRTGKLLVCFNSTSFTGSVSDDFTETGSVGITWSVNFNGSVLELLYTSGANNKTMRANVLRFGN